MTALYLIIGTLQRMHVFGVENRDTLTHKATGVLLMAFSFLLCCNMIFSSSSCAKLVSVWHPQYSAKLLKKPDQCRAVYACSHLFWANDQDGVRDGERCTSIPPLLIAWYFMLYIEIRISIVNYLPLHTCTIGAIRAIRLVTALQNMPF